MGLAAPLYHMRHNEYGIDKFQSMKPEIYAAKKAIVPIPIAMMRMIRSSLVIPANMTQDRGYFV